MEINEVIPDPPHKCIITGQSAAEAGPYVRPGFRLYDFRHPVENPHGTDMWVWPSFSRQAVGDMAQALGMKLVDDKVPSRKIQELEHELIKYQQRDAVGITQGDVVKLEERVEALGRKIDKLAKALKTESK